MTIILIEENELEEPTKVKLIAHSKCRGDTYDTMSEASAKYLYNIYNGEIPKKGYEVAFMVVK